MCIYIYAVYTDMGVCIPPGILEHKNIPLYEPDCMSLCVVRAVTGLFDPAALCGTTSIVLTVPH